MNLFLLFLFCVNGWMVQPSLCDEPEPSGDPPPQKGIDIKTKPVMCQYKGPGENGFKDSCLPDLKPDSLPCECDIIVFSDFTINNMSCITCDLNVLKSLTSIKPVILELNRENGYNEWLHVLKPENFDKDVLALMYFAIENNVQGYNIKSLFPVAETDLLNADVAKNIIPYIQQLKTIENFIIGINIDVHESTLTNPSVFDFVKLNDIVDYYEMDTFGLNTCNNKLYNGLTPLHNINNGSSCLISMEEATNNIKTTECNLEMLYYIVELHPVMTGDKRQFFSYNEVCTGTNFDAWCIENTNELFEKGKYVKEQKSGINVKYLNLDNTEDVCGCGTFVGLKNICAGFNGQPQQPCPKFDVQCAPILT